MNWCKLTNMTTCFTDKSFVWSVTIKPTGEKLPQYLQKVITSLWGTQEWLKCWLLFGLSDIKQEEQMLHMVEVPDAKKYMR